MGLRKGGGPWASNELKGENRVPQGGVVEKEGWF